MVETEQDRLDMLYSVLSAISLDNESTIDKATDIINEWINNTPYVKGYCRT